MKTIALVSQKGGSGKTTLALHLAGCALYLGYTVALIDLDPQGSAFDWCSSRPKSESFASTRATIEALAGVLKLAGLSSVDLAILDTAPHSNKAAAAAINQADLAIVPCRPSRFDLKAVKPTIDIVKLTKTPAVVVMNCCARGNLATEAKDALKGQGYHVTDVLLQQRVALAHSVMDGLTVHEYEPKGAAAANVEELFNYIKERVML